MATQGLTANTQPSLAQNEGNFLVGIHNITKDGVYVGAIKVGTGATLRQVATNVDVESGFNPGEILNRRQMGEHYELDVEFIEQTLENLYILFDFQQGPVIVPGGHAFLPIGNRKRTATMAQWCIYTEGPDGRNRRWTFFRAFVQPRGDVNIGHPSEVANVPVTLIITADRNYPASSQFGRVDDY